MKLLSKRQRTMSFLQAIKDLSRSFTQRHGTIHIPFRLDLGALLFHHHGRRSSVQTRASPLGTSLSPLRQPYHQQVPP